MLNVGPLELLVVLAVALIVVGPERLPELARSVGRVLRQFRDVQDEVRNMVSSEVDDDMRQAATEFRKVTGELSEATDVKGAVRRAEQHDPGRNDAVPGSRPRAERRPPHRPHPNPTPTDRRRRPDRRQTGSSRTLRRGSTPSPAPTTTPPEDGAVGRA